MVKLGVIFFVIKRKCRKIVFFDSVFLDDGELVVRDWEICDCWEWGV